MSYANHVIEFAVIYIAFSGERKSVTVSTHETIDSEIGHAYYAKNFSVFGCGKNAETRRGAVNRLVQDHSQAIISVTALTGDSLVGY